MRVLIVDDDPLARRRAATLAMRSATDVVVVGECGDADAAVAALAEHDVEVMVLDAQMPAGSGFNVVTVVGPEQMPPTIFCGESPELAVRAFDARAVDYLLKPYSDVRFAEALRRARGEVAVRHAAQRAGRGSSVPRARESVAASPYPDVVAVRSGRQYVAVRVAEIDWLESDGNYVHLHAHGRSRLLTKPLAALERDLLDPAVFVRVHRSVIVNVMRIVAFEPLGHGDLAVSLHCGAQVDCSRRYRRRLEDRVYFTT